MACPKNRVFSYVLIMLFVLAVALGIKMQSGYATPVDKLLTPIATIDLPGKGGRGGVVVYDHSQQLIYVAQPSAGNVVVISTQTNKIVAVVPGVKGARGIAVGPDYLYVAAGDENKLAVIDKTTWQVVGRMTTGGDGPEGVYYDPQDNKVFVVNVVSNTIGVISATPPFALLASFALSASKPVIGPELGLYEPNKNLIYQSWDNYVLVIDPATNKIISRIPTGVSPAKRGGAKGMVYDPVNNTLWVGTNTKQLLAMHLDTGEYSAIAIASGLDQLSWDPRVRLIFIAQAKAGLLGVVDATTGKYLGSLKTESGFHAVGVDYNQHLVYAYYGKSNKVVVYKENIEQVAMSTYRY